MLDLRTIARILRGEVSGGGVRFPPPGHSPRDRSGSFTPNPGAPDGFLINCFATGDDPLKVKAYVKEMLGMESFSASSNGAGKISSIYDYTDEHGELLFQVCRKEKPKGFAQRRPDGNGGWIWKTAGIRRVLYHLPELREAVAADQVIFICEGEKGADAVIKMGGVATCSPEGAEKWRDEYSQHFAGARVVILPDNDGPGEKHRDQVARSLSGIAASVKILELPDLPKGGDVFDWIQAGGTIEQLWELVETAASTAKDDGDKDHRADGEAPKPRIELRLIRGSDFKGKSVPPQEWVVTNAIPAYCVSLLMGDGSAGKTILSLQLAVAIAARTYEWVGLETRGGTVLFLSAEDDEDEIHRRLDRILRAAGIEWDAIDDLIALDLAGEDATLGRFDAKMQSVAPTDLYAAVQRLVHEHKPILVILDTQSDVFAGEANSPAQARQFIKQLRGLCISERTSVLMIAHPSMSGMASGTGTSGTVQWSNAARARLYFEKDKGKGSENVRVLTVKKANYGPSDTSFNLRWKDGVFVPEEGAVQAERLEEAKRIFLTLLDAYERAGRHVSHKVSPTYAPAAFATDQRGKGITRDVFRDAMNDLYHQGMIETLTEGPPSKPRSRIIRKETPNE